MKLSLNTATVKRLTLAEAVAGCVDAGITGIGVWRDRVAEAGGGAAAAKIIGDAGLVVTSLCRGGFFTRPGWEADNRAAITEAAELGTRELVLVVGGLAPDSRDLPGARALVLDALEQLVPHAREVGVRLAIEPLHPMFCADRAVVSTLGQALDLASHFAPQEVGVVVDTYHVWWDPQLFEQIARAAGRISAYQVCDWTLPLPADVLLGRGHVGDGHIEFAPITAAVLAAGYEGHVEVEIFNEQIWAAPGNETIATVVSRHTTHFPEF
ncbi:sugar phosphate isomerase/epimerase [Allocatelliglobosispora scoriae]|uniref:Sugar phosphate isomerase/epimerase n=1 Tax=Allocatelliglobosispora scoriae TaxID=643052 RepID=A0A841BXM7_9ACTN|nr:sugar phosphate isomerase/epimerase [Allocatelliglobosispora scoriae]MBB5872248.1 sugar phosphate isomerase/epimerase [Allocatelliglobosispora scoriae]